MYEVSDHGRVRSFLQSGGGRTKIPLVKKATVTHKGYLQVTLCGRGSCRSVAVHLLVLTAFVGRCPYGKQTRHLNGNHEDARLKNLGWGTAKENSADRIAHGTQTHGEAHPGAKMTKRKVKQMRRLRITSPRLTLWDIADMFGMSWVQTQRICSGIAWCRVPPVRARG